MKRRPLEEIPPENELPLDIKRSEATSKQGIDTQSFKLEVETGEGEKKDVVLKRGRPEEFADREKFRESKRFYDYLKSLGDFASFVPETLYFEARENPEMGPRGYRLQKDVKGRNIDEISDSELYSDKELMWNLLEFTEAAIKAFEKSNEDNELSPDMYGSSIMANFLFNPRHSTNIVIADQSSEKGGNRVFFVDTGKQIQQTKGVGRAYQRYIGSKMQIRQLKKWRAKLAKLLIST